MMLKLAHGDAAAEIGHLGCGGIRIDRPADQHQRLGLRFGMFGGKIGGRGQGQRDRLADGNDMGIGPKRPS